VPRQVHRRVRRLTREHCDHLIKIPMSGEVSSLNVSVAAGVCQSRPYGRTFGMPCERCGLTLDSR
jgi:hypothetical protein